MTINTENLIRHKTALLAIAASLIAALLISSASAGEAQAPGNRKILVLNSHRIGTPWDDLLNEGIREALSDSPAKQIELNVEYLDLARNQSDDFHQTLLHLLTLKYGGSPPEVIISNLEYAENLLLAPLQQLFPKANIISLFNGAAPMPEETAAIPNRITFVYNERRSYGDTLDLIRHLLPKVDTIFFICGATPMEQEEMKLAQQQFEKYGDLFAFSYMNGLPIDELVEKTGTLPKNSAILFSTYFRDGEGHTFIPRDVLSMIHDKANAPLFSLVDTHLGFGIVGGELMSAEQLGKRAGELALSILETAPFLDRAPQKLSGLAMFDWRELKRWNISEKKLPEGSIVRYREYSFWESYKWHVILGFGLLLCETGLIVFLFATIARRRKAEQENKMLEAQLFQSQKMESIGTLAGGIAHDFNNILAAMIGYTELALFDVEPGSPLEASLNEVISAGKRAKDLVAQILTFARRSREEIRAIDIFPVVTDAMKLLRATLPASIEINTRIDSHSFVMADPTKIHQIFMNLCVNAAHAMPHGGSLTVLVSDVSKDVLPLEKRNELPPRDYLKITISDTGEGISHENLSLIFEPYFTTKAVGSGTGLGLSVVLGIVKSYGGEIFVDTLLNRGTTFMIYLPVAPDPPAPLQSSAL